MTEDIHSDVLPEKRLLHSSPNASPRNSDKESTNGGHAAPSRPRERRRHLHDITRGQLLRSGNLHQLHALAALEEAVHALTTHLVVTFGGMDGLAREFLGRLVDALEVVTGAVT